MKTAAALISLSLAVCCASAVVAAPIYNLVRLGLMGVEHTRNDGYQLSAAQQLNEAGQVIGNSETYNGGSTPLGNSAWLYDGAATIQIGLTGAEHTSSNGRKYNIPYQLNETGQVSGFAERYNGNTLLGGSVWLYNGTTTYNIGLSDFEHTKNDGYKLSNAIGLNNAGQVVGVSDRYEGGFGVLGYSAWLYDGATTKKIGLGGLEHSMPSGVRSSTPTSLNDAGHVIGTSRRFDFGFADRGRSAWLYNGTTTINIGLTGPAYTRLDGYKYSDVSLLNEAGRAAGVSSRFSSGGGQSAWLYNGATTIDVGLTDVEHTRQSGFRSSAVSAINAAGQVVGYADRFNGGASDLGRSVWLYNGTTTINIGLIGPELTGSDGRKFSAFRQLNELGQVIGMSERITGIVPRGGSAWLYNGATTIDVGLADAEHTRLGFFRSSVPLELNDAGQVLGRADRYGDDGADLGVSTWFYDGTTTKKIGLTGVEHTSSDGYKFSYTSQMNEAGQAAGYSERYQGTSILGHDAWFHDSTLDQTFPLRLSTRSDGFAYSFVNYLGDDGLALGGYDLYGEMDNYLGLRAFSFTVADGMRDLGSLVTGGLTANGWSSLADAVRANSLGQILGQGRVSSHVGSNVPYLLTPVPEPTTVVLTALTIAALIVPQRRLGDQFLLTPPCRLFRLVCS